MANPMTGSGHFVVKPDGALVRDPVMPGSKIVNAPPQHGSSPKGVK